MMNRRHFLSTWRAPRPWPCRPELPAEPRRPRRAKLKKENKSLIILWMGGGPSHMDLWDLKPGVADRRRVQADQDRRRGVEISEILPRRAKQLKHLSIVRSLVTNEGSHERGTTLMNTGRQPSPIVQFPAIGSVVSHAADPQGPGPARLHRRRRHRPAHRPRLPRHDLRPVHRAERRPAAGQHQAPRGLGDAKTTDGAACAAGSACSTTSRTASTSRLPAPQSKQPEADAKRPPARGRRQPGPGAQHRLQEGAST